MGWEFCTDADFEEKLEWTRVFVRDEVMPLEVLDLDEARLRELIKPLQEEVKKQELWAVFLPPHLGGSGWGQVKMALLSEVLGEALWTSTVFGSRAPDSGNAELLAHGATPAQRDRYLRPLLDGEIRSCFAMTEPDAGSDPTRIRTTARPDGDGWIINGHKFASNASVAAFLLVMCVTDAAATPREGQSIFLVPRDTSGLTVVRNIPALDDHNPYFHAPQPDQHAEVLLEDVRVSRENLVGALGQGWELAQARLGPRPHPPLHALAGPGQPRLPDALRAGSVAGGGGLPPGRQATDPALRRAIGGAHAGGAADDPACRLGDRHQGDRGGPYGHLDDQVLRIAGPARRH
jgi:acyl-CoA dehydrogenase